MINEGNLLREVTLIDTIGLISRFNKLTFPRSVDIFRIYKGVELRKSKKRKYAGR